MKPRTLHILLASLKTDFNNSMTPPEIEEFKSKSLWHMLIDLKDCTTILIDKKEKHPTIDIDEALTLSYIEMEKEVEAIMDFLSEKKGLKPLPNILEEGVLFRKKDRIEERIKQENIRNKSKD